MEKVSRFLSLEALKGLQKSRIRHHFSRHAAYLHTFSHQLPMFFDGKISAFQGSIQPVLVFSLLGTRIGQFTHKMSNISPLVPGFGLICPDRPRRPTNLIWHYRPPPSVLYPFRPASFSCRRITNANIPATTTAATAIPAKYSPSTVPSSS